MPETEVIFTRTLKFMLRRKETPKKVETVTVRNLEAMSELAAKFDNGECLPHAPHFTFDRQLWVNLALHAGLAMRVRGNAGFLQALTEPDEESAGDLLAEAPGEVSPPG